METMNEILVQSELIFRWVNNENPEESIFVPWALVGQQADVSQSFGSGLTYVYRYFLLKYFDVSTIEDDPDYWRSKQREAEIRAVTDGILLEAEVRLRDGWSRLATFFVRGAVYISQVLTIFSRRYTFAVFSSMHHIFYVLFRNNT